MIIEISVAVIAFAFVVLVIFLIVAIRALIVTSHKANELLFEVQKNLQNVGGQAAKAIEHTNQISYDLKRKMEALNPLFLSITNLGEVLESESNHFKKKKLHDFDRESEKSYLRKLDKQEFRSQNLNNLAGFLEFAGLGIHLWQKIKKGDK